MNNTQVHLENLFAQVVQRYKEAMRFRNKETSSFFRVLHSVHVYGCRYVLHTLSRLRIPLFFGDISVQLFSGKVLRLPSSDVGSHTLALYGFIPHRSERKLTSWFIQNLKSNDVFYDIGTHFGFYTALAQALIQEGEVHAFEANPFLSKYLEKNFGSSSQVKIIPHAVAEEEGFVDFYDGSKTTDSSMSSRFNIAGTDVSPTRVSSITLDAHVQRGALPPSVIKLDIEGGEFGALVGGESVIQTYAPKILIEIWGGASGLVYAQKAVEKLHSFGYQFFELTDINLQTPIHDPINFVKDSRENFLCVK